VPCGGFFYFNKWCLKRGHLQFLLPCRSCAGWCSPAVGVAVPPCLSGRGRRPVPVTGSAMCRSSWWLFCLCFTWLLHLSLIPRGRQGRGNAGRHACCVKILGAPWSPALPLCFEVSLQNELPHTSRGQLCVPDVGVLGCSPDGTCFAVRL